MKEPEEAASQGSGPGPRDYTAGTRSALATLSQGTCYFPGCTEPTTKFIDGEPFNNFEMAHIRDAKPGNRYVENMTDDERRAFANLVLLCKPHHTLVDKTHPDRFSISDLEGWKAEREGAGVAALRGLRGLTEDRLEAMIRDAVGSLGPTRQVTVELKGGILIDDQRVITGPFAGLRQVRDVNGASLSGPMVVVSTVRNTGQLRASVEMMDLFVSVELGGVEFETTLSGRNDFPYLNPPLPRGVESGKSFTWLTSLKTMVDIVGRLDQGEQKPVSFWAHVRLGTGEGVESERHPVADLQL